MKLRRSTLRRLVGLSLLFLLLSTLAPVATAQVNVTGQWTTQSATVPINPIHAALMHNGKILMVAGSGNCPPSQSGCPRVRRMVRLMGPALAVYDPVAGTFTQLTLSWDMFCNGMVLLPDGRPFINSGTSAIRSILRLSEVCHFRSHPITLSPNVQNMAHGRWYPTLTTLGTGAIMTFSGLDEKRWHEYSGGNLYRRFGLEAAIQFRFDASTLSPHAPLAQRQRFYSGSGTTFGALQPRQQHLDA